MFTTFSIGSNFEQIESSQNLATKELISRFFRSFFHFLFTVNAQYHEMYAIYKHQPQMQHNKQHK